jgi:hypothetical protein
MSDGDRQIWIVEQIPWVKHNVPQALALGRRFGRETSEIEPSLENQAFVRRIFDSVADNTNVHRLDPPEVLCNVTTCLVMVDGHSLRWDDDHLSEFGAR